MTPWDERQRFALRRLFWINEPQRLRASYVRVGSRSTGMSVTRSITMALFAVFTIAAGVMPADASKPVPRTIGGCVFNGSFISSDGYHIQPRYADGREIDLRPFEGHALTISGDLLPGDAFILKNRPRDEGACKIMRPTGR